MKLTNILKESNRDLKFEKINSYLESGNFFFQKPYIFRGTNRKSEDVKLKDVTNRTGRKPVDTMDQVDKMIHDFYENCLSEKYPRRRGSSFATSNPTEAEYYGKVYVVLPHKSSKISHSKFDPYDIFEEISKHVMKQPSIWNAYSDEIFQWFNDNTNERLHNPVLDIANYFYHKDLRSFDQLDIPCFNELTDTLNDFRDEYHDELLSSSGVHTLWYNTIHIASKIEKYFTNLRLGYPENKEFGTEVMIDGKYLQIKLDLFKQYIEDNK